MIWTLSTLGENVTFFGSFFKVLFEVLFEVLYFALHNTCNYDMYNINTPPVVLESQTPRLPGTVSTALSPLVENFDLFLMYNATFIIHHSSYHSFIAIIIVISSLNSIGSRLMYAPL